MKNVKTRAGKYHRHFISGVIMTTLARGNIKRLHILKVGRTACSLAKTKRLWERFLQVIILLKKKNVITFLL